MKANENEFYLHIGNVKHGNVKSGGTFMDIVSPSKQRKRKPSVPLRDLSQWLILMFSKRNYFSCAAIMVRGTRPWVPTASALRRVISKEINNRFVTSL